MKLSFREIEYGSPYYEQAKRVRNDVLRVPLGLTISDEDTAEDAERLHFVALEDDTVIGTVSMMPLSKDAIKLRQMAVADGFRNKSVGQQLVVHAEQAVKELGYRKIEMAARCEAEAFYARLGYRAYGDVFVDVLVDHIMMEKALR